MSRVANNPLTIPAGVEVSINNDLLTIKGGKATLSQTIHPGVNVVKEDKLIRFSPKDGVETAVAQAGTLRALTRNMLIGLSQGYQRKLVLVGVGYRAQMQGKKLLLSLGFSHPVNYEIPEGIAIELPSQTEIIIKGVDKQVVGQVAAKIRSYRSPEPYKGKGVRYADERVILKEGKKK